MRAFLGVLVLACGLSACRKPVLPGAEALRAHLPDGTWLLVDGSEQEGARWFHRQGRRTKILPLPPVSLFPVGLFPSPDGRYLAVLSAGEGHPVLEVLDLPRLLKGTGGVLRRIDPYPGSIGVTGWAGPRLRVESDRPLAACCDLNDRVPGEEVSEGMLPFLMDVETGAIHRE